MRIIDIKNDEHQFFDIELNGHDLRMTLYYADVEGVWYLKIEEYNGFGDLEALTGYEILKPLLPIIISNETLGGNIMVASSSLDTHGTKYNPIDFFMMFISLDDEDAYLIL